jgi:predicted RNA-binding protein with EMAP domain
MNYSDLTEEEVIRIMKNLAVVDGDTLDYCHRILSENPEDNKKYIEKIEDRIKINIERMIMRRGISRDPIMGNNDTREKHINVDQLLTVMKSMGERLDFMQSKLDLKQPKLVRQVTSRNEAGLGIPE